MLSRTETVSRESLALMKGYAVKKPRNLRNLLVEQAKLQNQTAASLLHVDKEVNLIRYYGVAGYIREKQIVPFVLSSFQRRSFLPDSSQTVVEDPKGSHTTTSASASPSAAKPSNKTAKVAFMVTAAMRTELVDRLGYDATQIKTMTPLQASLILHHSVEPAQLSEMLPVLEQEHAATLQEHAEQQRQLQEQEEEQIRARALKDAAAIEEAHVQALNQQSSPASTAVAAVVATEEVEQGQAPPAAQLSVNGAAEPQSPPLPPSTLSSEPYVFDPVPPVQLAQEEQATLSSQSTPPYTSSRSVNATPGQAASGATVWYEIVEIDDDTNTALGTQVVALYKSEQEAALGLETLALFASRRANDRGLKEAPQTYEIRTTLK